MPQMQQDRNRAASEAELLPGLFQGMEASRAAKVAYVAEYKKRLVP
jgi:hypothetical protein